MRPSAHLRTWLSAAFSLAWITANPAQAQQLDCSGAASPGADLVCAVDVDGTVREFSVHVSRTAPAAANPAPLVIDLHGTGSSRAGQARVSGWIELSDEEGFTVVHPQSLDRGGRTQWNAGDCCEVGVQADDIGFMRAIVERVPDLVPVDPDRVFATGLSSGGAMTHFIGCEAADLFRAIAPVSFPLSADLGCEPSQNIGMIEFHALTDRQRAYDGFTVTRRAPDPPTRFFSVSETAAEWARLNGCSTQSSAVLRTGNTECIEFENCPADGAVSLCTLDGRGQRLGGHVAYRNGDGIDIPRTAWSFFTRVTAGSRHEPTREEEVASSR